MPSHEQQFLSSPTGNQIHYTGPALSEGKKPAVIYFALSAEMSLHTDPFNQPVAEWNKQGLRVFSWDLPFHGADLDPNTAMQEWAKAFATDSTFMSDFIQKCLDNLHFLHAQQWIDFTELGVAGLSRGGFIATHLAALEPRIKYVLGFAPLTRPKPTEEFATCSSTQYEKIALVQLAEQLTHTEFKFYIGNHDVRVHTDDCYAFIKELSEHAFKKGIRSPQAELVIYPSIGFRGHGTPPHIFLDGATWLKNRLIK